MSADNAYFVIHVEKDGEHVYSVCHGFMSPFVENGTIYDPESKHLKSLYKHGKKFCDTADPVLARMAALSYAHDSVRELAIVEYGVVEVELNDHEQTVHQWASEKEKGRKEIQDEIDRVIERMGRIGK